MTIYTVIPEASSSPVTSGSNDGIACDWLITGQVSLELLVR
jgi:hypothetical protein